MYNESSLSLVAIIRDGTVRLPDTNEFGIMSKPSVEQNSNVSILRYTGQSCDSDDTKTERLKQTPC